MKFNNKTSRNNDAESQKHHKETRKRPFWKYTFHEQAYKDDFKIFNFKRNLIISVILILFTDFIDKMIVSSVSNFLYKNLNHNYFSNIIFYYILLPYVIISCVRRVARGYFPTLNSIVNTCIYTFVYFIITKNNNDTSFLPLEYQCKFIDIIFIFSITIFSKWSLYFEREDTDLKTHQLLTEKKGENDLFGYKGLSDELVKYIHNTKSDQSFAIGILGNWGDGKSFLSNQIIEQLKDYTDDYITIDFNPWLYEKDQLIDGFFDEFLNAISPLDYSLKNEFYMYMSKITDQSNNESIQLANFLLKTISDKRSIIEVKKSIDNKIKYSRKKVLVIIDDIDRLDSEEIYSVLKIIRNSANFSNTFFIAGVDYNYINSRVENSKYLEKIFNVLVTLPKVSSITIKLEIAKLFEIHFPNQQELTKALNELLRLSWFSSYLKNLRQVNRLINSLKISYNKLGENVDLVDLILLETLKNNETKAYFDIFNDIITKRPTVSKDHEINNQNLNEALSFLFTRQSSHLRSFSNGYQLMFFNYSYAGIDIKYFYDILTKSESEILKQFNIWIASVDIYQNEFLQLLSLHLKKFEWRETYEKFVPILLKLDDSTIAKMIFEHNYLPEFYEEDFKDETTTYLNNLLDLIDRSTKVNSISSITFTNIIVQYFIKISSKTVENKKVSKIYQESLNAILKSNCSFEKKYNAFQKCILGTKAGKSEFDEGCIKIFKEYILKTSDNSQKFIIHSLKRDLNNEYPEEIANVNILDFISIVFEDEEEFKELILSSINDSALQNFLINNIDKYYKYRQSGKSAFYLEIPIKEEQDSLLAEIK